MHFFAFFSHIYIIIISIFNPSSVVSVIKTHVVLVIAGSNPTRARLDNLLILENFRFRQILDLDNFRQKNRVSYDFEKKNG